MKRTPGPAALPPSFTAADNMRLDSAEFAALAHRNPRAVVLLLLYDRRRYWGAPGNLLPNGGLAVNGNIALSRRTVAPFMSKGAQSKALDDLKAAGFIRITTPAKPPLAAARVLIVDAPGKWSALPAPKRTPRCRKPNGMFVPNSEELGPAGPAALRAAPLLSSNPSGEQERASGAPERRKDRLVESYTGPCRGPIKQGG